MKKKNTDGLQQELMDSPDLSQFLSQNQEQFENKSVAELLNRLFEKKHISKAALAKQAGMSEIYLHQIFAGRRNPSRNRLLCLADCFIMSHCKKDICAVPFSTVISLVFGIVILTVVPE